MILKDIDLVERKKLTSHFPVLIASETGKGKSTAFANLSDEEKARTVIFNFDNKAISEDDSKFAHVYSNFDIHDIEMVEKIAANINKAMAKASIDRVLLDTLTLMTKTINRWAALHYKGFDVWNAYNNSITQIIEALKMATLAHAKFAYVTGHYPPKEGISTVKRYLSTKGKEHTNILEESFSTVVESIFEDRSVYFVADTFDDTNTTKTKLVAGEFKFKRKSVDDLERLLNGLVTINSNEELEPVK